MHSQHYLQDDSTESLQTSVWWNFSKLVFELLHLTKKTTLCTILAYISNSEFQMVTLLSVFSVACNLDSEKSSATGHNLPVLLLLSRRWSLAVAVLLPHLRKNSVPIHRKNIQATQVKCSRNDNCDKLESRKSISKQRKRQKAPGFQRFCLSVAVPDKRWNQNEPKAILLQTFLFLNCCKTISCYFMLFYQRAPYLYRRLAFQVLQLLSMLFSSSSRWGILCLPAKRSFEKSWNIVSRETSNWHELTFNTVWFDCLSNCLSLVHKCTANITCRDDSTESLQTSVWWPTSTSASLSLSCCTSPKKRPFALSLRTSQTVNSKWWLSGVSFLLHAIWILKNQAQQVTTCLCCFCFQDIEFLLLLFCCRIWWRTLCLSTGRTFKPLKSNVAAMTTVTSWKAGSQFQNKESARKRLDFSDFVFQLLYLIKGGTKMNQRQYYYRLFCFSIAARRFHAISCYFMLFHPGAPYLYRGFAFQVLQLLSMLFSSSSGWGMLCLPCNSSCVKNAILS